ncbi:endolytic transglycosylase MltG [Psychromonas sp. RZ22]|uniref:endolytic transglycosylase MltG n=1 Tax=Psychromonas algarum TaxID=2555643 RepID=UPI001068701C|nr:endolytic transglycosylase MltG [Psychromonas sp. RZ22]TEW54359.1 endolytic transglycosylase MltG [Psychromonas sp. RZ22]
MIKKLALIFLLVCLILAGSLLWGKSQINEYLTSPRVQETQLFTLKDGSYFSHLGPQLVAQGLLDKTTWWKVISKLNPELTKIKSGTYQLPKGASLEDILIILNSGREFEFKLTFVEGSTYKDWLKVLGNAEHLKPLDDDEVVLLEKLGSPYKKIEGLLFPETYHYTVDMSAFSIIKKAYQHQQKVLDKLWSERDKNLPYKNAYEALIMASIIEKESGLSNDRDKISSVFVNRLRIGMRLQTDPTVIYGMGDRYDGRIRSKDLREKTAYNTYTMHGLPPTPIAMPSEQALYAALHPAKTRYLYFVSKGDGTSYFSKNLKEHNNAVNKYIRGK